MSYEKEQPSAFPNGNLFPGNRGLTMLDWFAAHAPEVPDWFDWKMHETPPYLRSETKIQKMARWSYEYADAMMAAREGK